MHGHDDHEYIMQAAASLLPLSPYYLAISQRLIKGADRYFYARSTHAACIDQTTIYTYLDHPLSLLLPFLNVGILQRIDRERDL